MERGAHRILLAGFFRNTMGACLWPALAFAPAVMVSANPLGELVRHGDVQFERLPGQLRIFQGSDKAIIDWEAFSIAGGELTEFIQPGANSAALNRVRGLSASRLDGALKANGRVFLLNPNGIVIGPGGTVDVGGFVASTLDIPDQEFLGGGDLNFAGASDASVVNLGRISALDGDVFLIAASVDNAGTISAPSGTVGLAAGNDVLLAESGAERVFVRGASGENKAVGVSNSGTIEANLAELKAHGGNIYGMAIKNEGRIAATGISQEGGQVFLRANGGLIRNEGTVQARKPDGSGGRIAVDAGEGGKIEEAGTLDAKGKTGAGGEIILIGSEIDVLEGALIIADGETQGGTVQIGGDPSEGEVAATRINLAAGSTVFAGSQRGLGGEIRVLGGTDSIVDVMGTLSVASDAGVGGTILIQGGDLGIGAEASIDASGLGGGGTVLAGGGLRGGDRSILNAENVTVAEGAQIRADATGTGDGGLVVLFANNRLDFNGHVSATGGTAGGNGGFVELSGRNEVLIPSLSGQVYVSSDAGKDGTLLIDPVDGSVVDGLIGGSSGNTFTDADIEYFLAGGSFFLETSATGMETGNIFIDPNVSITWDSGNDLSFHAVNDFVMGGSSTLGAAFLARDTESSDPSGSVYVDAGRSVSIGENASIAAEGGSINLTANLGETPAVGDFTGIDIFDATLQTTDGTIYLEGRGGTGDWNTGVRIGGSTGTVQSASGNINITGNGGSGANGGNTGVHVSGLVESVAGDVLIDGTGGTGAGEWNTGVDIDDTGRVISTGLGTSAASLTILGTGGSDSMHAGVAVRGMVESIDGAILIEGNGGGDSLGETNTGVHIGDTGSVSSTGNGADAASVTIRGTGGPGFENNTGVVIDGGVESVSGAIHIEGWGGGVGAGDVNSGILVMENGSIVSTGSGNDAASVTLMGTGGTGKDSNYGIDFYGSVESIDGDIVFDGQGGTSSAGMWNTGISIWQSATVSSIGTGSDAATVSITGVGGSGASENSGVRLEGSVASVNGAVSVNGTGGTGSGNWNDGINISGGAVESTGVGALAATITLTGIAQSGVSENNGFGLDDFGKVESVDGDIRIEGTGGGDGSGDLNLGIVIGEGGEILSTGVGADAAEVTLIGTGGQGINENAGVMFYDGGAVQSGDGSIHLEGMGGGSSASGDRNRGIWTGAHGSAGATVKATGLGNVTVIGNGGMGNDEIDGVQLENGTLVEVNTGDLSITGVAGGTLGIGVIGTLDNGNVQSVGTGSVTITGAGSGGASGVAFGNPSATLGGASASSVRVESLGGDVMLDSVVAADGTITVISPAGVQIGQQVTSGSGDVDLTGNTVTVNQQIDVAGMITFTIDDHGEFEDDGTIFINNFLNPGTGLSFTGGAGTGDTLTFAGYEGEELSALNFLLKDLGLDEGGFSTIEKLVGSPATGDLLDGTGSTATDYVINGPDRLDVMGVNVTQFENVTCGNNDDSFLFTYAGSESPLPSLSGSLDGGGGTNALDYSGYPTSVFVDLAEGTATAIGAGFSNISHFTGGPDSDTITGPSIASTYEVFDQDSVWINDVIVTGSFENVIGGPDSDEFIIDAGAGLSGYLDGNGSLPSLPGQVNTLDYSSFGGPVTINVGETPVPEATPPFGAATSPHNGTATGLGDGFFEVTNFIGSPSIADTFIGPEAGGTFHISAPNTFDLGPFTGSKIENLAGGGGGDSFVMNPGGSLTGRIDGAGGTDTLDYASFGGPVTVNVGSGTANGIGGFIGVENFIGSGARDTLEATNGNDAFTVNAPNAGALNATSTFSSFEVLHALNGVDLFNFLNQATVDGNVDGGGGFDGLFINDSNFGGGGTYNITAGRITRNPAYNFAGVESLQINAGNGNDTFNTSFLPGIAQILSGGGGEDTLNLTGAQFPANAPSSGTVGNVIYNGFEILQPSSGNPAAGDDLGGLLQIQLDQILPQLDFGGFNGFDTTNNFNGAGPDSTLSFIGIGAQLSAAGAGEAFSASGIGEGGGLAPGEVIFGISLDGSGALPSQFVQALIAVNLGIASRSELSLALGGLGEVPITFFDGIVALDASGNPALPGALVLFLFHLGPQAQSELDLALGGPGSAPVDPMAGGIAIALDGNQPAPVVLGFFAVNLGPRARSELSLALGGPGEFPVTELDGAVAMDGSGDPPPPNVVALLQSMLNQLAGQELE